MSIPAINFGSFFQPLSTNNLSNGLAPTAFQTPQIDQEISELDNLLVSLEAAEEDSEGGQTGGTGPGSASEGQSPFASYLQELLQNLGAQESSGNGDSIGSLSSGGNGSTTTGSSDGGQTTTGTAGGGESTSSSSGGGETTGSSSGGTTSGLQSLPGATVYNNLQDYTNVARHNGNDGIGGNTQNNGTLTYDPGNAKNGNVATYDSTFKGKGADTLVGIPVANVNPNDKKFLLTSSFDPTNGLKNTNCIENDMVITDKNGNQAQAGTQFNLQEKAAPGMCWFQTTKMVTGADGKTHCSWVNAAQVPIPKAGQNNTIQIGVTMGLDGGKQFEYGPLTYDGKTYQLQNNIQSTEKSNWQKNEVICQIQEDGKNGNPIDETYSNMSLQTA